MVDKRVGKKITFEKVSTETIAGNITKVNIRVTNNDKGFVNLSQVQKINDTVLGKYKDARILIRGMGLMHPVTIKGLDSNLVLDDLSAQDYISGRALEDYGNKFLRYDEIQLTVLYNKQT